MSYLLGAYGFAIVVLVGYAIYVVRQTKAAAARLRELETESQVSPQHRGEMPIA
jgi:Heme exporter protein D (CcmD)